jgi:3-hydroxyisobutyrate dehydrogenase
MKTGYIGMGIMGKPMAGHLLSAGNTLTIYNRSPGKGDDLARQGAGVAASPAETAKDSDVVFINVSDTPDVESVLFGPGGVIEGVHEGLIVVDNSTISPDATKTFAQKLSDKGCDMLDAPVSGGDIGAQKGTLSVMVGGEKETFDKCLPLLETFGSKITHVGPIGSGQICKACNQLFCALHMLACSEGIALARRAGIDPAIMVDVVSSGAGGSWALSQLGPRIVAGDFDPGFMIDLICKDLRVVMEMGHALKAPLAGAALATQLFQAAQAHGLGDRGTQALSVVVEKLGNG